MLCQVLLCYVMFVVLQCVVSELTHFYCSVATYDYSSFAYQGTSSIQWTTGTSFSVLQFQCASNADCFSVTQYTGVSLWVYLTVAGTQVDFLVLSLPSNAEMEAANIFANVPANTWTQVCILVMKYSPD
jgi:hypothetical protein